MNSQTLKETGFTEFIPLKGIPFTSVPYNKNSVIVLVDCTVSDKPSSDILFIGKSRKPTKRVFAGYLAGYGGKTTRKIHSMLFNDGFIEKVAVGWMLSDKPKTTQKQLLEDFKKEHGEYPKWNASKKTSAKPQQAAKIVKAPPSRKPKSPRAKR
jgi:hypothetical protein